MSELTPLARVRSRLRDSSWFLFGVTTALLIALASAGTAVLVQFGVDEGHDPFHARRNVPVTPVAKGTLGTTVTVERIVGSFQAAPQLPRTAQDGQSLAELLGPPAHPAVQPPSTPPPTEPPLVPEPPAVPVTPPPAPEPPPVPVPVPSPPVPPLLPLPLPIPLPTLPVPLPHL